MKPTAKLRGYTSMWEPETLLPSQMPDPHARARCPEIRLVAAVFGEALQCIAQDGAARSGPRRREYAEACRWFLDDSRNWPFTFTNVCDLLGLDVTAVRQSLSTLITAAERKPVDPADRPPGRQRHREDRAPAPAQLPNLSDLEAERQRFEIVLWDEV